MLIPHMCFNVNWQFTTIDLMGTPDMCIFESRTNQRTKGGWTVCKTVLMNMLNIGESQPRQQSSGDIEMGHVYDQRDRAIFADHYVSSQRRQGSILVSFNNVTGVVATGSKDWDQGQSSMLGGGGGGGEAHSCLLLSRCPFGLGETPNSGDDRKTPAQPFLAKTYL